MKAGLPMSDTGREQYHLADYEHNHLGEHPTALR